MSNRLRFIVLLSFGCGTHRTRPFSPELSRARKQPPFSRHALSARAPFLPSFLELENSPPFRDMLERAVQRRSRDAHPLRDDANRETALFPELPCELELGGRDHSPRPTQARAASSSALEPRACPFAESRAFLLCDPAEDCNEQRAHRTPRVHPPL